MNTKTNTSTASQVIRACFAALVQLESTKLTDRSIERDDEISFHRARNELYAILSSNGYAVKFVGKLAHLKQADETVLTVVSA